METAAALSPGREPSKGYRDFFVDPLPSADAYILMEVIRDWPDAEASAIFTAVRRAASPGSRMLIENVLGDTEPDSRGHTLDVIMLAITGGRERTASQVTGLLEAAGFADSSVIETAGPLRIAEAVAG